MSSNGQLSESELSPIAGGVVGSFAGSGQLADNAAAAWNAFAAECRQKAGSNPTVNGPSSAYRNLAMQWYFWRLYQSGQGNLAAYPGSSNHGWGLATDTPPYVWSLMRAYGGPYGWGACSDAPSEAWHRKWCENWHGSDPGPAGTGSGGRQKPRYPTLKKGDKGGAVKRAQRHLNRWNLGIGQPKVDGDFGESTQDAVRKFQLVHDLHADGVIGHHTWHVLRQKDHFLHDERSRLNRFRLLRAQGAKSKDAKHSIKVHKRWMAKRAHAIAVYARQHGWKPNHRRERWKTLRRAAGVG